MAETTRERLLRAAGQLLQRRGYHGMSLSDVLQESGAPRGSLYFHFPGGKAALALEATRAEVAAVTRLLEESFAAHADAARATRASFEAMAAYVRDSGYTLGCPAAPLTLDVGADAPELAAAAEEGFESWHAILATGLARGGIPKGRARNLATLILAAQEGGILLARAKRDVTPLLEAGEEAARVVRAAMPPVRLPKKASRGG